MAETYVPLKDRMYTIGGVEYTLDAALAEVQAVKARAEAIDLLAREEAHRLYVTGGNRDLRRAALDAGREAMRIANEAADEFNSQYHG